MPEPKIVEAVGTAVHSDVPGLAEALEEAMVAAVQSCIDEGIPLSNSEEILKRKEKARQWVLEHFNG